MLIYTICKSCPTSSAQPSRHVISAFHYSSSLWEDTSHHTGERCSVKINKCQLPSRDSCSKAAFVLDGPCIPYGSGLCCRTVWCHTWAHRQCEHVVCFQYTLLGTQLLISGSWEVFFKKNKKTNGLHKGNVNLMVHESTFLENKH